MADLTTSMMMNGPTMADQTHPTTGNPKAMNDDLDVEIVPELYPWTNDESEKRRAFIFEFFNWNPDISGKIQVEQLTQIEKWLSDKS